jgi:histidinol phosphatase-like PHP family hydrolase
MAVHTSRTYADVNAVVGGYLRDLAFAQSSQQKMFGYKRAAAAILSLDVPLTDLVGPDGALPRISGIGPGSARIIGEVLDTGESPTVERAIDASERRSDIERRRHLRRHFLSRAEVIRILREPSFAGLSLEDYRGDLQMHSEWSDGYPTVQQIAEACLQRGYRYAAVTDHSHGLKIAGGMSMAEAADQRRAIDDVNAHLGARFRLLQGIEANIDAAGQLDLSDDEAAIFDVVLAAPHSRLRRNEDQTERMIAAVAHPTVRILAHPRGRITGRAPASLPIGTPCLRQRYNAAWRLRSMAIRRDRISITPWPLARWKRAASSPSTATRTPPISCHMPRPRWPTRA